MNRRGIGRAECHDLAAVRDRSEHRDGSGGRKLFQQAIASCLVDANELVRSPDKQFEARRFSGGQCLAAGKRQPRDRCRSFNNRSRFAVGESPLINLLVSTPRRDQRAVGRNSEAAQRHLARSQFGDFIVGLIPDSNLRGLANDRRKSTSVANERRLFDRTLAGDENPLRGDCPDVCRLVRTAGDKARPIRPERNGTDNSLVPGKPLQRLAGGQVPDSNESSVARDSQSRTVRAEGH